MIKNRYSKILTMLIPVLLMSACASTKRGHPDFAPVMPRPVSVQKNDTGSIYQSATSWLLYEDLKARRIGDMLTVTLDEKTDAQKSAETGTSKETDSSGGVSISPNISGKFGNASASGNLDSDFSSSNEFEGKADSSQSNSLRGSVTVVVVDVLSNGNLKVQGEKWININQGEEFVRLRGIVRPIDIDPDNTISSVRVANAQIQYSGSGTLANANKKGWLARFFSNPLMPF